MTQWLLQHAGWIIVLAAVAFGSSWITQWWTPEPQPQMLVNLVPEIFDEDDLISGTTPTQVDVYEAPTDTTTDTIIIPEWLDTAESTSPQTTLISGSDSVASIPLSVEPNTSFDNELHSTRQPPIALRGLNYVITPMTQGHPSLSVERTTVTLQSLSPKDGRMLEWTYDIPKPSWRIGLQGTVAAGPSMSLGLSTIGYGRRFEWGWMNGWVSLGGGYGVAAVRDRVATGPVGNASITLTLLSR